VSAYWEILAPHLRLSPYGHRTRKQSRVEVLSSAPKTVLTVTGACATCGQTFLPVRERSNGRAYLRVTCGEVRCMRHERARTVYTELLCYLRTGEAPAGSQLRLMEHAS